MSNNESDGPKRNVTIRFASEFKRNLRQLAKKYRKIRSDLQPLVEQLLARETPGDRISGVDAVVYKVRLRNTDSRKGSRGGYRVVYYVQMEDTVVLLTIYSKTEQGDVSTALIRQVILEVSENRL